MSSRRVLSSPDFESGTVADDKDARPGPIIVPIRGGCSPVPSVARRRSDPTPPVSEILTGTSSKTQNASEHPTPSAAPSVDGSALTLVEIRKEMTDKGLLVAQGTDANGSTTTIAGCTAVEDLRSLLREAIRECEEMDRRPLPAPVHVKIADTSTAPEASAAYEQRRATPPPQATPSRRTRTSTMLLSPTNTANRGERDGVSIGQPPISIGTHTTAAAAVVYDHSQNHTQGNYRADQLSSHDDHYSGHRQESRYQHQVQDYHDHHHQSGHRQVSFGTSTGAVDHRRGELIVPGRRVTVSAGAGGAGGGAREGDHRSQMVAINMKTGEMSTSSNSLPTTPTHQQYQSGGSNFGPSSNSPHYDSTVLASMNTTPGGSRRYSGPGYYGAKNRSTFADPVPPLPSEPRYNHQHQQQQQPHQQQPFQHHHGNSLANPTTSGYQSPNGGGGNRDIQELELMLKEKELQLLQMQRSQQQQQHYQY